MDLHVGVLKWFRASTLTKFQILFVENLVLFSSYLGSYILPFYMHSVAHVCGRFAQFLPERIKHQLRKKFDPLYERNAIILDHIGPKDEVLDVGCVGHELDDTDWQNPPKGVFLHHDLCQHAAHVEGIDIVESEVKKMAAAGYNVHTADAQDFELDKKFDVIVAGELIEHVENPGLFLRSCRKHLKENGVLILSTPNPQHIKFVLHKLIGKNVNPEHTLWVDHDVIETLAGREGFSLDHYEYFSPTITLVSMPLYFLGIAIPITSGGYVFKLSPSE